jgi:hypothetical protein
MLRRVGDILQRFLTQSLVTIQWSTIRQGSARIVGDAVHARKLPTYASNIGMGLDDRRRHVARQTQ